MDSASTSDYNEKADRGGFVYTDSSRPISKTTYTPHPVNMGLKFALVVLLIAMPMVSLTQICERRYQLVSKDVEISRSTCLELTRFMFFIGAAIAGTILLDLEFDGLHLAQASLARRSVNVIWLNNLLKLKTHTLWTMFGLCSSVGATILFPYNSQPIELSMILTLHWKHLLVSTCYCILFGSLLILVEKVAIQLIAVRFHKLNYRERLEENQFAVSALNFLKDQFLLSPPERKNGRLAFEKDSFASPEASDKIFESLRPVDREFLLLQDLTSFFTTEDAERLFGALDRDGNGDITKSEFTLSLKGIEAEQDNLSKSLAESDSTIRKLDSLFMAFVIIILLIVCSMLFKINISSFLATFGTLFVSFSFIFGGPLAEIFESIIFVFVTHAFDVGDKVMVESETYVVQEVGFLVTTLLSKNRTVYYPTATLKGSEIHNIRRSPNQFETLKLYVAHSCTKQQIDHLQTKLSEFVHANSRDFGKVISISGFDIVSDVAAKIEIYFEYKSNFQEGSLRTARRNKFMLFLREQLDAIEIPLAPPPE